MDRLGASIVNPHNKPLQKGPREAGINLVNKIFASRGR